LLPELLESRTGKVKVWSAGCACGDEVYSFKIVWECLKKSYDNLPKLEVLATDMNPAYLERARAGVYTAASLKEVKKEIILKYFDQQGSKNLFAVKALLAGGVAWEIHYLLCDPPGLNFDIIFLRNNVLTYYQDRLKKNALSNVLESLAPSGLLVIGSHETLPCERHNLVRVAPYPFVYQKQLR
jgi:chemotaxis protein methyltransferase CheR